MLGFNHGNWGLGYNQAPNMQTPLYPPGFVPPQPIGQIGLGYNPNIGMGGYYSGQYQYYDPMEIRRLEEERRKAEQDAIKNYIEIQKLKSKAYFSYIGIDHVTDEYLEKYYDPNTYVELYKDQNDYDEMCRLATVSSNYQKPYNGSLSRMQEVFESNTKRHPVDQSFQEFMDTAGQDIQEIMQRDLIKERRKDIRNRYDHEAYSQLTNLHQSSFASLRENVSIDDMTVELPSHLRNSYQERKAAFMAHLMADPRNA